MTIRENQSPVKDLIFPRHVLVSVFDKTNLSELVLGLCGVNPHVHLYSTGGTGAKIQEILGVRASENYTSVEEFTNCPEMEGGLVKTLHPKVHAGLLGERGNPRHIEYLEKKMAEMTTTRERSGTLGVFFDVLVCNLYAFGNVIQDPSTTPETARVNIDIGGAAMVRASAKNWPSVAVVTDPRAYTWFLDTIQQQKGTTLADRFTLAQQALRYLQADSTAILNYFFDLEFERDVRPHLKIEKGLF